MGEKGSSQYAGEGIIIKYGRRTHLLARAARNRLLGQARGRRGAVRPRIVLARRQRRPEEGG